MIAPVATIYFKRVSIYDNENMNPDEEGRPFANIFNHR